MALKGGCVVYRYTGETVSFSSQLPFSYKRCLETGLRFSLLPPAVRLRKTEKKRVIHDLKLYVKFFVLEMG